MSKKDQEDLLSLARRKKTDNEVKKHPPVSKNSVDLDTLRLVQKHLAHLETEPNDESDPPRAS